MVPPRALRVLIYVDSIDRPPRGEGRGLRHGAPGPKPIGSCSDPVVHRAPGGGNQSLNPTATGTTEIESTLAPRLPGEPPWVRWRLHSLGGCSPWQHRSTKRQSKGQDIDTRLSSVSGRSEWSRRPSRRQASGTAS